MLFSHILLIITHIIENRAFPFHATSEALCGDRNTALGGVEDLEANMASVGRDEMLCLFGPFDTGDGGGVVHKILEPDVFELLGGIEPVAVEVIERHLSFIDMHKNKRWALHLLGMFEPQAFGEALNESGLSTSQLSFQTKHTARLQGASETLRKLDRFLR